MTTTDKYDEAYLRLNACRSVILQLPVNDRLRLRYRQCRQALANAIQEGASGEFSAWAAREAEEIAARAASLATYRTIGRCMRCGAPIMESGAKPVRRCPCGGRVESLS